MLGFISAEQAKKKGLTHHAIFCGIPCYAALYHCGEYGVYLQAKCCLLEPVLFFFIQMSAISIGLLNVFGIETNGFRVLVGNPL